MAEALAVIGLVSSIVQFVDFGTKVVGRLTEYMRAVKDVPSAFSDVHVQLPLLMSSLEKTRARAEAHGVDAKLAESVREVVKKCDAHVRVRRSP
jgi:hypothetical protein